MSDWHTQPGLGVLDNRYVNVSGDTMTGALDFDHQGAHNLYTNILTVSASGGADYTSLSTAVAAATSGQTILLYPGTYTGNITLPSGVALAGVDRARCIIAAPTNTRGPTVKFTGSNYISNVTVQSTTAWTYYIMQWAASGGGVVIESCDVSLLAAGDGVQHYLVDTTNMTTGDLIIRNSVFKINSTTNNVNQILTCLFINNKSTWGTIDVTQNQFIARGSSGVAQGIKITTSSFAFPNGRGIYGNAVVAFNQTANALSCAIRQESGTINSQDNFLSGGILGSGSWSRHEEFVRRGESNSSDETIFQPSTATEIATIFRGASSQSANIVEIENSSAADLFTVSKDGAVVVNEQGADADSRIEGDTDANLIYTDASTDRVGIGTATPDAKLHVSGTGHVTGAIELDDALNHDGTTIGFFGTAPATQTTVADAGALVTTETADGTYDTTEQDMLNNLLTDVTALRTKLNALLDALQSYGLV